MATSIHPDRLRKILDDGREYALLDVRERGRFARAHLFLAINLPLSHLELRMRRYVPRYTNRVLLCDDDSGLAARAARIMEAAGYTDVSNIEGGVYNCAVSGFELFRGHYVTTYAFGLYVDQHYHPPRISPDELSTRMDSGEKLVVIDSRTEDEFRGGSIPGAINVPLGELPCRIHDLVSDPGTPVVVCCGAVTRGVLGGESLIEAGLDNPVLVLTNGVRGWELAGHPSEAGSKSVGQMPSAEAATLAAEAARSLAVDTDVHSITPAVLNRWRADQDRTLFVVDVRTREEYEAGHLPDAIWIPGGELIGLYEDHIGTMNARICLVDDNGARATLVASWLGRMGWPDVAVLDGGIHGHELTAGPRIEHIAELSRVDAAAMNPEDLSRRIQSENILLLDFADSSTYMRGHIPGAWWTLRSRLPELVDDMPASDMLVATCPDSRLASLAARDLADLTHRPVAVLTGGTEAWRVSGRGLAKGLTRTLGEVDDAAAEFVVREGDDPVTVRAAQRRMLDWQGELLQILQRDRTFSFPELPVLSRPHHRK